MLNAELKQHFITDFHHFISLLFMGQREFEEQLWNYFQLVQRRAILY